MAGHERLGPENCNVEEPVVPFTISWTGMNGGEWLEVSTAADALKEARARIGRFPKVVVTDDRGVKLSVTDLEQIVDPFQEDED